MDHQLAARLDMNTLERRRRTKGLAHSMLVLMALALLGIAALLLTPAKAPAQTFSAVAAGFQRTLALKTDGTLWAWGDDSAQENRILFLGDGEFIAIATGWYHSLALKADGSLWGWGNNDYGQAGNDGSSVGEGFTGIAAGRYHSLGIKSDGSLWAWGYNGFGQLGDGTTSTQTTPVQVGEGFTAIAAGQNHSLGIKTDGSLWAWGQNRFGQLGDGTDINRTTPVQVGEGFIAIAAGGFHSLGLKADGSLWAWGLNTYGQLGDGATVNYSLSPLPVGVGFTAIAAGWYHSLGLKADNTLWAWGANTYGQLGDGSTVDSSIPITIAENFTAIAAGGRHSLGVKTDGSLWAWGFNDNGQLGDGTTTASTTPVLVGGTFYYLPYAPGTEDFALGIAISNMNNETATTTYVDYFTNDGENVGQDIATIPANGQTSFMSGVSLAQSGWARITASHPVQGMALVYGYGEDPLFDMDFKTKRSKYLTAAHVETRDGWGSKAMLANPHSKPAQVTITFYPSDGGDSQAADLTIPSKGSVQYNLDVFGNGAGSIRIYADQGIVGFLLYDGRARGSNWAGGLSFVPSNLYFSTMAGGDWHSLGLEADGSLWAWGYNSDGRLGDGSMTSHSIPVPVCDDFASVAAGFEHSLGLKADGSLWAWGENYFGQLGDGTKNNRSTPVQVGEDFVTVSGGGSHSLGVKTDGSLWAWGGNENGQLGDGTENNRSTPVQVGEGFSNVSAGSAFSLALKIDGSLWAWGRNWFGQLGIGSYTFQYEPNLVGEGFVAIAAGQNHSLGIKTDGTLWGWGYNEYGQLGDGTTTDHNSPKQVGEEFVAIAAGQNHSLGIKTDGTLWGWGSNRNGQLGDGTTTDRLEPTQVGEDFTAVVAGQDHSLGLKSGGVLWTWGENAFGALGDGTGVNHSSPVRIGKGFGSDPNDLGEYIYYLSYAPDAEDFNLGFGIASAGNNLSTDVTVEYYSNGGAFLGQDIAVIPSYGQTSFMCGVTLDESGWARVASSQPLYGMALVYGHGGDPMFDMDFKTATAVTLTAAHMYTRGGWVSKAMLANPGDVQADVTVTFYPDSGVNTQTKSLTIPAKGAVQYDLAAAFPASAGSIKVASDQGIVGFLLYDGRSVSGDFSGFNYVGGLSMVEAD